MCLISVSRFNAHTSRIRDIIDPSSKRPHTQVQVSDEAYTGLCNLKDKIIGELI